MNVEALRAQLRGPKPKAVEEHLGFHRVRMMLRMRPPMRAYLDTLDATELGALMSLSALGLAVKLPGEDAYKLTDSGFETLQEYMAEIE